MTNEKQLSNLHNDEKQGVVLISDDPQKCDIHQTFIEAQRTKLT